MKTKIMLVMFLLAATLWAGDFPDAPSATAGTSSGVRPVPTPGGASWVRVPGGPDRTVADAAYWTSTAALWGSTVANIELSSRCMRENTCLTFSPIKSRAALYGIALPMNAGLTVLSYKLKKNGHVWWMAPVSFFTAGHSYAAVRAANRLR